MQTFLPYPDFIKSMACLDPKRLGNQVYREGMTLLRGKWPNHLASKMWQGYDGALQQYLLAGVAELKKRGKDYSTRPWCLELNAYTPVTTRMPPWLGNELFHASHRSNLIRKDPIWYGKFGWTEPDNLPYIWPVK